jgi:transcriptional/translational regulatory protein YebC/TACO1
MAGHQWSKAVRQHGALDAKCGKLIPKLASLSTLALAAGGFTALGKSSLRSVGMDFHGYLSTDAVIERTRSICVPTYTAFTDHLLESPLEASPANDTAGEEFHFNITPRDHLPSVDDSLFEADCEPDSTTLICLRQTAAPLGNVTVAAQSLRIPGAPGENDDVQYVHAKADIAEEPLVKIGG